jgi:hypothetical protein
MNYMSYSLVNTIDLYRLYDVLRAYPESELLSALKDEFEKRSLITPDDNNTNILQTQPQSWSSWLYSKFSSTSAAPSSQDIATTIDP